MLTSMGLIAMSYGNIPYVWGGDNPLKGLDCSGFIQLVLKEVGIDPIGDQTAQMLYTLLSLKGWRSVLGPDSLLFFGSHRYKIGHVALALTDKVMIEAGGGDSTTVSIKEAILSQARVRIVPISRRKDLVATLKVEYTI